MLAVTNYHQCGGLKQNGIYSLPLLEGRVGNKYHWADIKVLAGHTLYS